MAHWSHDPVKRAEVIAKIKGTLAKPGVIEARTEKIKEIFADPDFRQRRAAKVSDYWLTHPEESAARVEKMRATEGWQASTAGRFKGGKVGPDGRVYLYRRGRYRPRARLVMEDHLGRILAPTEHVHHINEDPTDDRIENLQVLSRSEHTRLHALRRHRGDGAISA